MRLIPPVNEEEADQYCVLFYGWLLLWRKLWTLLLQSVLTSKVPKVHSLLPADDCQNFDKVKALDLKAYKLVPEALLP